MTITVRVPENLYKTIHKVVKRNPIKYRSIQQFFEMAVIEYLKEIEGGKYDPHNNRQRRSKAA